MPVLEKQHVQWMVSVLPVTLQGISLALTSTCETQQARGSVSWLLIMCLTRVCVRVQVCLACASTMLFLLGLALPQDEGQGKLSSVEAISFLSMFVGCL